MYILYVPNVPGRYPDCFRKRSLQKSFIKSFPSWVNYNQFYYLMKIKSSSWCWRSDLCITPEESVRHGNVNIEVQHLEDVPFHNKEFLSLVGVITNVQEVIDAGRTALLDKQEIETLLICSTNESSEFSYSTPKISIFPNEPQLKCLSWTRACVSALPKPSWGKLLLRQE